MVLYYMHLFVYVFICLVFFGKMIEGLEMYLFVSFVCLLISVPVCFLIKKNNRLVRLLFEGRWKE